MSDATTAVAAHKAAIRAFADARGWEPYHSPKNLVMALASEVGELCDVFRWLTPDESRAAANDPRLREAIADELADVANIVLLLSAHTGIDLSDAIRAKLVRTRSSTRLRGRRVGPGGRFMGQVLTLGGNDRA